MLTLAMLVFCLLTFVLGLRLSIRKNVTMSVRRTGHFVMATAGITAVYTTPSALGLHRSFLLAVPMLIVAGAILFTVLWRSYEH